MTPEKPIFWHQGLFLQPQHFQQTELHQRSQLVPLHEYRQPFLWGIRTVDINASALLNRTVELTGFEAVFQDFSWVVAGKNATVSARSFADQENAFLEGDAFTVYIGLKKWDVFNSNVSGVADRDEGSDRRYISLDEPVEQADLYDKGPPAQMRFLEYNLKLFWQTEKETAGDYHLIPILRLKMNGEVVQQDKTFVPPPLTLDSSSVLLQVVKNIREQMLARCRVLETYKPIHGQEIGHIEMSSLYYLLALNTLNRHVAKLQHALSQPLIHPWHLYGLLTELVGELSTFSDRINCLGQLRDGQQLLNGYDHLDVGGGFQEIQQLIAELLDGVVIGSERILIMTREDDRFWCEIPAEILRERQLYCLMVRTGHEGSEVVNALMHLVKSGSLKSIDTLIARSLSGVSMVHREIPPLGIARRQGCYCFELNTGSSQWSEVEKDGTLCLHWDQAPDDAAMELVTTRT